MAIRKTQFEDYRLMQLQQDIDVAINQAATLITKGVFLKDIDLSTEIRLVDHKLNRIPEGFVICGQNADAVIWSVAKTEKTLSMQASAPVRVSVWVF